MKKKLFANDVATEGSALPHTPVKKRKTGEAQGGSATKKIAKPRSSKKKVPAADKEENVLDGYDEENSV